MTTTLAGGSAPISARPDAPEDARRAGHDAFVERLLRSAAGAFDMFTIHIGDQLGLYAALAAADGLTPRELAARTGTHERYVREWLEQQTVSGILSVDDVRAAADARRYRLPAAHAEALTDAESMDFLAPLAQSIAGAVRPLRYVLDAFRDGSGVPYGAYGAEFREGQARMNRALLLHRLGQAWLPAIPDVHARLLAAPPAHVADIGCGAGWSSIGIARAYPRVRVDGIDLDAPSVELARANAEAYGVADRVRFEARDAADARLAGRYDLVLAFETVHDMSDPVAVLGAMRRLAAPGAAVLVMDERVGDAFTAEGSDFEWLMYGWSVLHCLPVGMAEQPSAGTGTVMRTDQLRGYARAAGFTDVEVLPIEHPMFRVYRLAR
jgi:2-polyprenyl-3-methyl-5-hydroxy-6-metoxy-1,4-benzoquinol methylase